MNVKILSVGQRVAEIVSDDVNAVVKMIAAVIADDPSSAEEFDLIEDISVIRMKDRVRGHFYWGGPEGDLFMVAFS